MAKVIDGKRIAAEVRGEIAEQAARLKEKTGVVPGLAVIIVGETLPHRSMYATRQRHAQRPDFTLRL